MDQWKSIRALLLLTTFALLSSHGLANPQKLPLKERVVGGTLAPSGRYPYSAALFDDVGLVCGGTLIHPKVILTAGHCTYNIKLIGAKIGAKNWMLDDVYGRTYYGRLIKKVVRHPDFARNANRDYDDVLGDVALLFLSEPVPNSVPTIKIIQTTTKIPNNMTAIGYGQTEEIGDVSLDLRQVDLKYVDKEKCKSLLNKGATAGYEPYDLTIQTICAGRLEGGKDTCYGDSGGPLMYRGKTASEDRQVGVTSFGEGCAQKNTPAGYANLRYFRPWIEATMAKEGLSLPKSVPRREVQEVPVAPRTLAATNRYPYSVGLFDDENIMCGGALIHPKIIITAAHCTYNIKLIGAKIGAKNWMLDDVYGRTYYGRLIEKVVRHPDFAQNEERNYADWLGDVALVYLSSPVPSTTSPLKLLPPDSKMPTNLTAIGYFSTSDWGDDLALDLRQVSLKYMEKTRCIEKLNAGASKGYEPYSLTTQTICAARPNGVDGCYGHEGGPLVVRGKTARDDRLVGVTSFSDGCGANSPTGYSSIRYFYDWIQSTMAKDGLILPQ